ncbi:DUF4139 domain-containing protein [Magnetospirillum aberrantis]|uniref:DUF4139 domain-containing protein n=1 Tax=Magnetospirillum aberrantis SpK TaxID=908842 RepID=A0A7C9URC5_9PROT|nr:DUF4139 domain-containing protein [Magnetospirillum aberrantis]NFV78507.1 DUF4139 domain-containing protein [Magnetospirillum aberrantis SpK]
MKRRLALITTAAFVPLLAAAGFADTVVTPADRGGLALTVTQNDTALVRDHRTATFERGSQVLVVEGVARAARDGSAMLSGGGLVVHEQGFLPGGVDAAGLLAASVGRDVTVVWRDAVGAEREERARVVAAGQPPLFQVAGKVVAGEPARILYDSLPPELRTAPAYRAAVTVEQGGKRGVELSYLTSGLSWQADYVAELTPAGDKLSLSAWATLVNVSGADFPAAKLQLLAGDVGTVANDAPPRAMRMEKVLMAATMAPTRETAGGVYHLYTVAQPVSLGDGERKQVALVAPQNLTVSRQLILDPLPGQAWRDRAADPEPQHPQAVLRLKNGNEPLPSGTIRVFQRARDGGATFLGEDQLGDVPAGAEARVTLGRAFDVTARRVQTDFNRVSAEITEAQWQVRLANAGDTPAQVVVRESLGGDWLVLDESAPHKKENAFTATWTVEVPARGEQVLSYRVRVKG